MSEKQPPNQVGKEFSIPFNYLYFFVLFLTLAIVQTYHLLLIGNPSHLVRDFYIVYAVLESFVEVLAFSWISLWILSKGLRILHLVYLCTITALFFCRLIDFAIVRLMDLSVWYWISLISQETFSNFIEMLYAANIKLSIWFFGFLSISVAIGLSCVAFYLSDRICKKRPIFLSSKVFFSVFVLALLLLASTDLLLYSLQDSQDSLKYSKALPWKRTLLDSPEEILTVQGPLRGGQSGFSNLEEMDSELFSLERKPDLFLFVVESLRDDFLTEEVTPSLVQFREENVYFKRALSNGNSTVQSWFSLFYSMYPFYWAQNRENTTEKKSLPLALLKKMGYQIHVYSSSRLQYYSMDKVLFGEVDHLNEFRTDESITASESDAQAMSKLYQDVQSSNQKGGRLFVVLLDATHFGYSWPETEEPLFTPIENQINYFELVCGRSNLELVKNRYKNALHYVDTLFASFQKVLKEKGLWEESVVIFTADHGEDFEEQGCIFHASKLSQAQLQIPLYMKLGEPSLAEKFDSERRASQMDIFPTIFHYLMGEDVLSGVFQGETLLGTQKKSYVVGSGYNASLPPREFYIQKDNYQLTLEFCNHRDIFHSRSLKVKSIRDEKGEMNSFSLDFVRAQFEEPLNNLFPLP